MSDQRRAAQNIRSRLDDVDEVDETNRFWKSSSIHKGVHSVQSREILLFDRFFQPPPRCDNDGQRSWTSVDKNTFTRIEQQQMITRCDINVREYEYLHYR